MIPDFGFLTCRQAGRFHAFSPHVLSSDMSLRAQRGNREQYNAVMPMCDYFIHRNDNNSQKLSRRL
jgi:hypothetical protein